MCCAVSSLVSCVCLDGLIFSCFSSKTTELESELHIFASSFGIYSDVLECEADVAS